jgi:hypothetical protein
MATYKHLRSSTANKRPTTSITDGQLAINTNTASPGLFFKDSAGAGIVKVGPVHVGTTAPNATPAAGGSSGNYTGEQWLDTSVSPAQMKVWNGSAWVGIVADELPVSKLQDGAARQLLQTDAAGTGVEWTSNVDVPGTLDVTGATTLDSTLTVPLGSAASPTLRFSGDANSGLYSPGADQVAVSTGGTGRLFVDASGNVKITPSQYQAIAHKNISASASYGAVVIGSGSGSQGNISLGFDVSTTTGFNFTGTAQTYFHPNGALIPNNAGTDYIGLFSRDSSDSILLGPATSSGKANGPLTLTSTSVGIGTSAPQSQLQVLDQIRVSNSAQSQGSIVLGDGGSTTFNVGIARWNINTGSFGAGGIGYFSQGTGNVGGHYFYTGDAAVGSQTARMVITPAGDVGIGTASPSAKLEVVGGNIRLDNNQGVEWGGVNNYIYGNESTDFIAVATNGNERSRWDSSGRLLVGTSSARSAFGVTSNLQAEGTDYDGGSVNLIVNNNSGFGNSSFINLCRSRGTANGSTTVVQADDSLGAISWCGADGSDLNSCAATIRAFVDGTPGAGDMPGRIVLDYCGWGEFSDGADEDYAGGASLYCEHNRRLQHCWYYPIFKRSGSSECKRRQSSKPQPQGLRWQDC